MTPKQIQKKDQELYRKQQIIQQMQQQESTQLTVEIQKKTDSIIKKIYHFFDEYGKKNGYQYIYGKNTASATLMYGDSKNDITKEVLKMLDAAYESEKN